AFAGEKPTAGYGIEIIGAIGDMDGVRLIVEEHPLGPGMLAAQVLTSPFHIVSFPRTEREVRWSGSGVRGGGSGVRGAGAGLRGWSCPRRAWRCWCAYRPRCGWRCLWCGRSVSGKLSRASAGSCRLQVSMQSGWQPAPVRRRRARRRLLAELLHALGVDLAVH